MPVQAVLLLHSVTSTTIRALYHPPIPLPLPLSFSRPHDLNLHEHTLHTPTPASLCRHTQPAATIAVQNMADYAPTFSYACARR